MPQSRAPGHGAAVERPLPRVVKDHFFADPDRIRRWALEQRFRDVDTHNRETGSEESWPGQRSACLHELHSTFVQQFVGHILGALLRLPPCDFRANCSFQLTTCGDGNSWIHRDDALYTIGGLIYLTPDPPPRSGTVFYRRSKDGFELTDVVANQYNRLLLFDSQSWHKSDRYFGDCLENGRLTLPFFIEFWLREENERKEPGRP